MKNWIDVVAILSMLAFTIRGYSAGMITVVLSITEFILSVLLAQRYTSPFSLFITSKFGIPLLWARPIAGVLIVFVTFYVLSLLHLTQRLRPIYHFANSQFNRLLGAMFGALQGSLYIAILFLLVLALPVQGTVKQDVQESVFGNALLTIANKYAPGLATMLSISGEQVAALLLPSTADHIVFPTRFSQAVITVNEEGEQQLLNSVNAARIANGVEMLRPNSTLQVIARAYSEQMVREAFFAHVDAQGNDVSDRLEAAGITYQVAGENLALAPDIPTIHEGLMQSPGHRRNILDPQFTEVGIGIVDTGGYGKMATQIFIR